MLTYRVRFCQAHKQPSESRRFQTLRRPIQLSVVLWKSLSAHCWWARRWDRCRWLKVPVARQFTCRNKFLPVNNLVGHFYLLYMTIACKFGRKFVRIASKQKLTIYANYWFFVKVTFVISLTHLACLWLCWALLNAQLVILFVSILVHFNWK